MSTIANNKKYDEQPAAIIPIRNGMASEESRKHLVIKDQHGYDIIPFHEIVHCQADGNYTSIYTCSGKHFKACKTMKYIESKLPTANFVRIHQSHVVAISAIRRIDSMQFVMLSNGSQVPYSRRSKPNLLFALEIVQRRIAD